MANEPSSGTQSHAPDFDNSAQGVFLHGVGSGDVTAETIVLWTHVPVGGAKLHWICIDDSGAEISGSAVADSGSGAVHVVVQGLCPDRRYSYRFELAGVRSEVGRFRTLPIDSSQIRFAVASCARFTAGYFNAYRQIAELDDLHFVLVLGDFIYELDDLALGSTSNAAEMNRRFEPRHECRTIDDYRIRYEQHCRDTDTRAMRAAHAVIAILDDHELADNAWSGGAGAHVDAEHGPWSVRLSAALQAWREWTPTDVDAASGDSIWRSVQLGNLGTLALLETRTARTDPSLAEPAERSALGKVQRDWLCELARSADGWLVVGSPSKLTDFDGAEAEPEAVAALETLRILDAETWGPNLERWSGFPCERDLLLSELAVSTATPIVVAGDVHIGAETDLAKSGETFGQEWTTFSVSSQNLDDKMGYAPRTTSRKYETRLVECVNDLKWCDLDSHGFMVVSLTEAEAKCDWWIVESVLERTSNAWIGHTAHVTRPNKAAPKLA